MLDGQRELNVTKSVSELWYYESEGSRTDLAAHDWASRKSCVPAAAGELSSTKMCNLIAKHTAHRISIVNCIKHNVQLFHRGLQFVQSKATQLQGLKYLRIYASFQSYSCPITPATKAQVMML